MSVSDGIRVLVLVGVFSSAGWCAEAALTNTPGRAGGVQFAQPAPYSTPAEVGRRSGYQVGAPVYDLARESFRVMVPTTYSTNTPWGLLVWISPGNDAWIPPDWAAELERQRLIFVAPYKSGNDRHPIDRMRLALDATCNVCRSYKIDRKRIYVGGFSGGGRITSILGVAYSDLFTGALCICGVNFYKEVPTDDGQRYPATYFPEAGLVQYAKKNHRFVLLTGDGDINRDNTKSTAEKGFKANGFLNVLYLEVQGMKHAVPGAPVLKTALGFLDGVTNAAAVGSFSAGEPEHASGCR